MAKNDKTKTEDKAIKTLELPRYTLSLLYTLLNVPLHGPQLRARNHFAKTVRSQLEVMEEDRIKMLENYADKDKRTKEPLKKEGDQEYQISAENLSKYQKEFDKYMKEKWIIDLLPSVKPDVVLIRPLILETRQALGTVDGYAYEDIATAFEAM